MPDATWLADLGRAAAPLAAPLVAWTALALVGEAVLRLRSAVPAAGALAARRGLVFSLPLALAAPVLAPLADGWATPVATALADGAVLRLPALAAGLSEPAAAGPDAAALGGVAVLLGAAAGVLGVVRLGVSAARLGHLRAASRPAPAPTRAVAHRVARAAALRRTPRLGLGPAGTAPFTLGARSPLVVVPRGLEGDALRLALAHEFAHVRRRDFAWTLAERAVVALCAAHPLVHVVARGAALDRECIADADVLHAHPSLRRTYADLLVRFASTPPPHLALGVGGPSPLKHRIHAMQAFSSTPSRWARWAGRTVAAGCAALIVTVGTAGASAGPPLPASDPVVSRSAPAELGQAARPDTTLPELVGGLAALQEAIVYPRIQREAGVEGRTFVQFVVTEAGGVSDIEVARSSGDEALDAAAAAAVEAARFRPGTVDGRAVPVRFVLPVTFRLGPDPSAAPPPPPPPPSTARALPELVGGLQALQDAIVYPELQRRAGVEGTAYVQFVVDASGDVRDVQVARSAGDEGLDAAAVAAVRSVVFRPALRDGQAASAPTIVPVRFALPDAEER